MKKRIVLIVIFITLIICGVIVALYLKSESNEKKPNVSNVTNKIENYEYVLYDNATPYYKELFGKLKNVLESDNVDDELYASLVSQLFISNFYSLSNKINSSDVGGYTFIVSESRANFVLKAKDKIYKTVKSNLYGERDQELPIVTKVSIDSITKTKYNDGTYEDESAYNVKASVIYDKNLGYPTTVKLTLIHNNNVIEIAKVD